MDRITRIRIENVRAIERIDLEVNSPLTVLIGENGSCKSTIIECLELLRKAADPNFMQQFYAQHRGMPGLLRKGAKHLGIAVRVDDDSGESAPFTYSFWLATHGAGAIVEQEEILLGPTETENACIVLGPRTEKLSEAANLKRSRLVELTAQIATLGSAITNIEENQKRTRTRTPVEKRRAQAIAIELQRKKTEFSGLSSERDSLALEVAEVERQLQQAEAERRRLSKEPLQFLRRSGGGGEIYNEKKQVMAPVPGDVAKADRLVIASFGDAVPIRVLQRLIAVLRGIEVHLGFDTLAAWAARSIQRPVIVRAASTLFPAERLNLLGVNLASAWSDLIGRDSAHFDRTMALVKLGLGERVDKVVVPPDAGGGNVYLALRFTDLAEPILASDLSDGQLAWLAFVAMVRLNERRSLLAVDEPELHLHPQLLGGVINLLASAGAPVVVATHSDRVLELIDEPARAVRVCELDEAGRATLAGVDPGELAKWLAHFGDFGRLRAAGYLSRVLRPAGERPEEAE